MSEIRICDSDFDVAQEYTALCSCAPQAGAVVFFVGRVRDLYDDINDGNKIEYLELEHYPGMTESLCQETIDKARARYAVDAVRVVHRVGRIYAAEQIVMVAVASRHRDTGFKAAQYIMDYLKTRATFWKKEVGSNGENWIGMKDSDQAAVLRWRSDQLEPSDH